MAFSVPASYSSAPQASSAPPGPSTEVSYSFSEPTYISSAPSHSLSSIEPRASDNDSGPRYWSITYTYYYIVWYITVVVQTQTVQSSTTSTHTVLSCYAASAGDARTQFAHSKASVRRQIKSFEASRSAALYSVVDASASGVDRARGSSSASGAASSVASPNYSGFMDVRGVWVLMLGGLVTGVLAVAL